MRTMTSILIFILLMLLNPFKTIANEDLFQKEICLSEADIIEVFDYIANPTIFFENNQPVLYIDFGNLDIGINTYTDEPPFNNFINKYNRNGYGTESYWRYFAIKLTGSPDKYCMSIEDWRAAMYLHGLLEKYLYEFPEIEVPEKE